LKTILEQTSGLFGDVALVSFSSCNYLSKPYIQVDTAILPCPNITMQLGFPAEKGNRFAKKKYFTKKN